MAEYPTTPPANLYGAVDLSSLVNRARQPGAAESAPNDAAQPQADAEAASAGTQPVARLSDPVVEGDEQALQEFAQLSQFVPVLVELHAAWSSDSSALAPVLARLVRAAQGRLVLLRIDLDAHPSLGSQPHVLALIGGRGLELFSGNPPEQQLQALLQELRQLATSQGVQGYVEIDEQPAETASEQSQQPAEPSLPPLHEEAYQAAERGDYEAAVAAFEQALREQPGDDDARAGLAQVQLLRRLQGKRLNDIRQTAALAPDDVQAQLDVADLDISGGHIEDAFDRLLNLFPKLADADREAVRERLLELFQLVGNADPRVGKARLRLTSLLF